MFLQKTWCILAYSVNCTLKNIHILLSFIPKDKEHIRKERVVCFIVKEKTVFKMEK